MFQQIDYFSVMIKFINKQNVTIKIIKLNNKTFIVFLKMMDYNCNLYRLMDKKTEEIIKY